MKTRLLSVLLAIFVVISIITSTVCYRQYAQLQRQKIYSISNAFTLMQNELEVAAEGDYKTWHPSGVLEMLEGDIPFENYNSMGDYRKIHDVIRKVLQMNQLNDEKIAYLDEVRQMKISTSTYTWKWAVYLK